MTVISEPDSKLQFKYLRNNIMTMDGCDGLQQKKFRKRSKSFVTVPTREKLNTYTGAKPLCFVTIPLVKGRSRVKNNKYC